MTDLIVALNVLIRAAVACWEVSAVIVFGIIGYRVIQSWIRAEPIPLWPDGQDPQEPPPSLIDVQ